MDNSSFQNSFMLPIVEIGKEAAKEKKGRSPIFNLHFWWARKPLVASRASLLSLLLPDNVVSSQLSSFLGLEEKKRAYRKDLKADLPLLRKYYKERTGSEQPKLLDPFAGGGSIAYEGLRMGLDVVASDYNPVAHNIQLGTLYYPKLYAEDLHKRVEEAFQSLRSKVEKRIRKYYPQIGEMEPSTYMYAWGITCPFCKKITPAVNNWVLKTKPQSGGKTNWIYLLPVVKKESIGYEIISEEVKKPTRLKAGNCRRGEVECLYCNSIIGNKTVVKEIKENEREVPLCKVIVLKSEQGKHYVSFSEDDIRVTSNKKHLNSVVRGEFLPSTEMPRRVIASAKYLTLWKNLLNPRQKLFFSVTIEEAINTAREFESQYGDPWGRIVATYFAMFVGKSVDFNNRGSSWAAKEGIRNSLAFRRPSMAWDHIEVNPFASKGSGTWQIVQKNILDGIKTAVENLKETPGSIQVQINSVFKLDFESEFDLVVTDPPYGDDVQYSELSEFFYAWESIILREFYDYLPEMVHNDEDLSVNNIDRDGEYMKFALELAFEKIRKMMKPNGQMGLFFAHGKLETWAFVINALRAGEFQINATFPIHTESKDNVIALGKASFMTSVLILSTLREESNGMAYIEDLQDKIVKIIREKIPVYLEYGLKDSDLSMVILGPALQELTSYAELRSITGEVTFDQILTIANQPLIEELIGGKESLELDAPTKFYLYCRVMGIRNLSHDTYLLISKSLGLDLRDTATLGFVEAYGTSKNKQYRILGYKRFIESGEIRSLTDFIHLKFKEYTHSKESRSNFWLQVSKSKYSPSIIQHILKIISLGIVNSQSVRNSLDAEALIASELLKK